VLDHVRLVLTLELRRELAEKLSLKAIKSERNIEVIIIGLIEAAARRWLTNDERESPASRCPLPVEGAYVIGRFPATA